MVTKEKYQEIVKALKELNSTQTVERKAGKLYKKEWQRVMSKYSDIHGWEYYCKPDYIAAKDKLTKVDCLTKEQMTLFHILYNRIRKRPPHTGSVERDCSYISNFNNTWDGKKHFTKLILMIEDVHEVTVTPDGELNE